MKETTAELLVNTYWDYFKMQSAQRMKMIEFYISIMIVLIGGFFAQLSMENPIQWALYLNAAALPTLSLVFYLLDQRTHFFINEAEKAIGRAESELFQQEEKEFQTLAKAIHEAEQNHKAGCKYEWCFNFMFGMVSLLGIVFVVLLMMGKI